MIFLNPSSPRKLFWSRPRLVPALCFQIYLPSPLVAVGTSTSQFWGRKSDVINLTLTLRRSNFISIVCNKTQACWADFCEQKTYDDDAFCDIREKPHSRWHEVNNSRSANAITIKGVIRCLREIAKKRLLASSMSFRLSAWNNSAATVCISMKFYLRRFFENLSRENSSFIEIWKQ